MLFQSLLVFKCQVTQKSADDFRFGFLSEGGFINLKDCLRPGVGKL